MEAVGSVDVCPPDAPQKRTVELMERPRVKTKWVRTANQMHYSVTSSNDRTVQLEASLGMGLCKVPLKKFYAEFKPMQGGKA